MFLSGRIDEETGEYIDCLSFADKDEMTEFIENLTKADKIYKKLIGKALAERGMKLSNIGHIDLAEVLSNKICEEHIDNNIEYNIDVDFGELNQLMQMLNLFMVLFVNLHGDIFIKDCDSEKE